MDFLERIYHYLRKLKYPQKSILGFKLLSSIESSLSAYCIILIIYLIEPFFGISSIELIASIIFNIIAYSSITILILNLCFRSSELNKVFFIFFNFPLFLFIPNCFLNLIINSRSLINYLTSN